MVVKQGIERLIIICGQNAHTMRLKLTQDML